MNEKHELIERTVRMCAVAHHPSGELQRLAREMGVTPKVFRYWWTRGRIPRVKAVWLETRFGKDIADAEQLTR